MDYSLLLGVHVLDHTQREEGESGQAGGDGRRPVGQRVLYSTPMESIQGDGKAAEALSTDDTWVEENTHPLLTHTFTLTRTYCFSITDINTIVLSPHTQTDFQKTNNNNTKYFFLFELCFKQCCLETDALYDCWCVSSLLQNGWHPCQNTQRRKAANLPGHYRYPTVIQVPCFRWLVYCWLLGPLNAKWATDQPACISAKSHQYVSAKREVHWEFSLTAVSVRLQWLMSDLRQDLLQLNHRPALIQGATGHFF